MATALPGKVSVVALSQVTTSYTAFISAVAVAAVALVLLEETLRLAGKQGGMVVQVLQYRLPDLP
jgi:hypothetical protein